MKKIIPLIMLFIILCGCSFPANTTSESFFAMDTYMTVTVNGSNSKSAVKYAENEIKKLDKKLSAHNKNSEIYKLNKNGSKKLSDTTLDVLDEALDCYKLSEGAFNPAMLTVSELWGFPDKNYRVPSENEIKSALKNSKPEKITEKDNLVTLNKKGLKLDLGGIAKGYASGMIIKKLKEMKINSALLNLGGNIAALGSKPDGCAWTVAIENPDKKGNYLVALKVKDKDVITSGGYERNFKKNGKTYHHILNPENGYPAESGLKSVTIIGTSGAYDDAFSTAMFVMGKEKALRFWAKGERDFDAVIYTDKGELLVTEGVSDIINSELNYKIVKRSDYE